MISEKALKEFKAIYKKKFDVDLSNQDALESATKLLKLVEIIYKPMTKEEHGRTQKKKKGNKIIGNWKIIKIGKQSKTYLVSLAYYLKLIKE